ncbi:MAG: hypothetical protein ACMUIP_03390 [bacterium]
MDIQLKNDYMQCPRCDFEQPAGNVECLRCGIIFTKFEAQFDPDKKLDTRGEAETEEELFIQDIDKEGWLSMCAGIVPAALIFLFPFLEYIFHTFATLVHEFGHTVFGWLFGYPTIPAFDFVYGGGVAVHFERKPVVLIIIYCLFLFLLYTFRKNYISFITIIGIILLYSLIAFTRAHEILILFMGHGMELIFAAIFIYRAISGSAIKVSAERPLYAFVGFFTQFCNINFAYKLLKDSEFRTMYEMGKGGFLANDFVRIAQDYLQVKLNSIIKFFLFLSFLPPIIAFLAHRYLAYWVSCLNNLCNTNVKEA